MLIRRRYRRKIKILTFFVAVVTILFMTVGSTRGLSSFSTAPPTDTTSDVPRTSDVSPTITPPAATTTSTPYKIAKVVDGDTIDVELGGKTSRVRLLGINAPESVDPRKTVECFGREASAHLKDLLTGKDVALESDATQGDADKYDRLLRYVYLGDGADVGRSMIADGYAYEYTYDKPYKYQSDYKTAEAAAREAKRGLWAAETCNGKK